MIVLRYFNINTIFIMRPTRFTSRMVATALQQLVVATIDQLCEAVGGCSVSTMRRKLKGVKYLTSYSHAGMYYTLCDTPEFDEYGLWEHNGAQFSRYGTLRETVYQLVSNSSMGYQPVELDEFLHIRTVDVLSSLVRTGALTRVRFAGRSIYCGSCPNSQKRQLKARRLDQESIVVPHPPRTLPNMSVVTALFLSILNEKQIRLLAGFLSLMWGYGGDTKVALFLGISRMTVRSGRKDLMEGNVEPHRVRKPGGGRPPVEKKSPGS